MALELLAAAGGLLSGVGSYLAAKENRRGQQEMNAQIQARLNEIRQNHGQTMFQLFGGDPMDPASGLFGQAYQALQGAFDPINQGYGDAIRNFQAGLAAQRGRFDKAEAEVNKIGSATETNIARRGKAAADAERKRREEMGLLSSAEGGRGAVYDTNLAMAQLGEQLAGIRSGLQVSRGQAAVAGGAGLADLQVGRGNALAGLQGGLADVLMSRAGSLQGMHGSLQGAIAGHPYQQPVASNSAIGMTSLINALGGGLGMYGQFNGPNNQTAWNDWGANQQTQQAVANKASKALGVAGNAGLDALLQAIGF